VKDAAREATSEALKEALDAFTEFCAKLEPFIPEPKVMAADVPGERRR
jgi:hypothetical protein